MAEIQSTNVELKDTEACKASIAELSSVGDDIPKAPPSTPSKEKATAKFADFPRFRVTWDASEATNKKPLSPGRARKLSQSNNPGPSAWFDPATWSPEMTPETTLIEFIATSASFHAVKRQNLKQLEDDLMKVFPNNIMPANAAAWYMAKRRFYTDNQNQSQLLAILLRNYPEKFLVKNNEVHFLEDYSKQVAKKKMQYMVEQGLYAYFSHKVDEYGVYFFDPYYYENTEPFHANLRLVTNIFNTHRSRLVPAFFAKFQKPFVMQQLSPYLVAISKAKTDVLANTTGIIVSMLDHNFGIVQFHHGTGTERAMFSMKSLFVDGFQFQADPLSLPPVTFDGYKIPGDPGKGYRWLAVLVWCGRKPNPKYCSTKGDLMCSKFFLGRSTGQDGDFVTLNNNPVNRGKADGLMRVGEVVDIQKNGAVVAMQKESDKRAFVPGWLYKQRNTPNTKYLTTTQGVCLMVGDLITFIIDKDQEAKPFNAVGRNAMLLERSDKVAKRSSGESSSDAAKGTTKGQKKTADKKTKKNRKTSTTSATSDKSSQKSTKSKPQRVSWREFLLSEPLADDEDEDEDGGTNGATFVLPEVDPLYDSDDSNSEISQAELDEIIAELPDVQMGVKPVVSMQESTISEKDADVGEKSKDVVDRDEKDSEKVADVGEKSDNVAVGDEKGSEKVADDGEKGENVADVDEKGSHKEADDGEKTTVVGGDTEKVANDDEEDEFKDAQEHVEQENSPKTGLSSPKQNWASFLLEDDMSATDNYDSDEDPEYVPPPIGDPDLDYDEYSDGELSGDEADDLFKDGREHFGEKFPNHIFKQDEAAKEKEVVEKPTEEIPSEHVEESPCPVEIPEAAAPSPEPEIL